MLVVIEGVDGTGKSAVSTALAARLGMERLAFPDRSTPTGKAIDGYLKGEWRAGFRYGPSPFSSFGEVRAELNNGLNALVFQGLQLANKLEHANFLHSVVVGTLAKGLVLDRYWPSAYAYGKLDGLDPTWLIESHQNLPQAQLNILLDAPPHVSIERIKARGGPTEHYEREELFWKLRANYHEVWGWGRTQQGEKRWVTVNAVGTKDEVLQRVLDVVGPTI